MSDHSAEEVIEVGLDDLRAGDALTMNVPEWGGEFTGPVVEMDGRLGWALLPIDWWSDTAKNAFVRATRHAPTMPTEPGSVIYATEVRGVDLSEHNDGLGALLILDGDGEWMSALPYAEGSRWHPPKHITRWTPAKIVPATGDDQ